ncbi:MAG: SDR family oxidoreductase [Microbacteriaceae bacterium]|jgi:uncharacterized protein YbjT (DUF2867 family)|nr:SDR family oxidoreductase [Microbacteriaceae bacterium]
MRVLILGGHGHVARLVEPLLVSAGHTVDGLIRKAAQAPDVAAAGAVPVVADLEQLDDEGVAEQLAGHDAVVWSAGAGGGDARRTYAVDRDAAIRTIRMAERARVRRFVMVSYLGAGFDHRVPETDSFFPYAESKAAADAELRASKLDWTILGPGALTEDAPVGRIECFPHAERGGIPTEFSERLTADEAGVSRADVAGVIAAALTQPRTIRRTVDFIGARPGRGLPIAEALGSAGVGELPASGRA